MAKQEKAEYEKVKSDVIKAEERNFSNLILFRSGDEWFKMGGHSLLIYYYDISKKILNQLPTIQPDTDYTSTIFEEGILSFRGTDALEKRLKKAKVFKNKKVGKNTVFFELNFSVTQTDITDLKQELYLEQERALAVLKPASILQPEIYKQLRHIQKRVYEATRKMSVFDRDYNGLLMAEYSRKMTKYYMLINSGKLSKGEGWTKILDAIEMLIAEITFATELKQWRQDVAVSIGAELIDLRRAIEKERIRKSVTGKKS